MNKKILFLSIIIGMPFILFSGNEIYIGLRDQEVGKYANPYHINIYNICQAYESNDKKLDCLSENDIRLGESLEKWVERHLFYQYPNRVSIPKIMSNLSILFAGIGIILASNLERSK